MVRNMMMKMVEESEKHYRNQKAGKKAEWKSSTVKSSLINARGKASESNFFPFFNSPADLPFH